MSKYAKDKICGYYLYFTGVCTVEAMHAHSSESKKLQEGGSTKFWVYSDGSSKVDGKTRMSKKAQIEIQKYIARNYMDMYELWRQYSSMGFKEK